VDCLPETCFVVCWNFTDSLCHLYFLIYQVVV